jgi:hypothetical protein
MVGLLSWRPLCAVENIRKINCSWRFLGLLRSRETGTAIDIGASLTDSLRRSYDES